MPFACDTGESRAKRFQNGALAQLGERLLCKQGVIGSIPIRSTTAGRGANIMLRIIAAFVLRVPSLDLLTARPAASSCFALLRWLDHLIGMAAFFERLR